VPGGDSVDVGGVLRGDPAAMRAAMEAFRDADDGTMLGDDDTRKAMEQLLQEMEGDAEAAKHGEGVQGGGGTAVSVSVAPQEVSDVFAGAGTHFTREDLEAEAMKHIASLEAGSSAGASTQSSLDTIGEISKLLEAHGKGDGDLADLLVGSGASDLSDPRAVANLLEQIAQDDKLGGEAAARQLRAAADSLKQPSQGSLEDSTLAQMDELNALLRMAGQDPEDDGSGKRS
jgi:hypothetical protein